MERTVGDHTIQWEFGDSSVLTSEGVREREEFLNPSHNYSQNGTYTVKLTITDSHFFTTSSN
ncbi:PKD domain-containing protein [Rivularia sp. UHCC 0363]|uniref:PKD domain-containing protein n=1 Tax=Rivularia sp. UHCC 0363 TaxID=3110244 RepID=UPI003A5991AE